MIELPRRSVTRFFIPLIDVLTVLFCIFLLMPLIKATEQGPEALAADASASTSGEAASAISESPMKSKEKVNPAQVDTERIRSEKDELEKLQKEKIETLQKRLSIRVLEIDADTGKLFYNEGDQRVEIGSQDEALKLIARHRDEAAGRELYYLFLFPRRLTGYPEERQLKQYENWFKGVANGRDNPLAGK